MSKAVLERERTAERTRGADLDIAARNAEANAAARYEELRTQGQPEEPEHEHVAQLAYALWEQGGHREGTAEEDWFRAEEILRIQRSSAAGA